MKILLQAIKSLIRKAENSIKRVLNFFDEGEIIKQEHLPDGYPYEAPAKILPNTTLEMDPVDGVAAISTPFSLVAGCKYTVTWNGTDYVCEAKEASLWGVTGIGVGNVGNLTGEPFVIIAVNNTQGSGYYGIVQIWNEPFVVTFSISSTDVTKMDVKYLPDGYPYQAIGEILPSTTLSLFGDSESASVGHAISLIEGVMYTVVWNGRSYSCVAQSTNSDGSDIIYVGSQGEGEDYPFLIGVPKELAITAIRPFDGSTTFTISITGPVFVKMDARYLPDPILSSPNGTRYKITVDDNGTLSATAITG